MTTPARTRRPARLRVLGVGVVVALSGTLTACSSGGDATCDDIPDIRRGVCLTAPADRPPAPTDAFPVLGDEDREIGLGDYAGEVVVLNFWASWCGPCRAEQPILNDAVDALDGQGVAFLGVDLQENLPANGIAHEAEFAIPYPSIYDPSSAYAARFRGIGASTIPSTVLIDRQGRVATTLYGQLLGGEVEALAAMLAAES